jgi:hypothetical protein
VAEVSVVTRYKPIMPRASVHAPRNNTPGFGSSVRVGEEGYDMSTTNNEHEERGVYQDH